MYLVGKQYFVLYIKAQGMGDTDKSTSVKL